MYLDGGAVHVNLVEREGLHLLILAVGHLPWLKSLIQNGLSTPRPLYDLLFMHNIGAHEFKSA